MGRATSRPDRRAALGDDVCSWRPSHLMLRGRRFGSDRPRLYVCGRNRAERASPIESRARTRSWDQGR